MTKRETAALMHSLSSAFHGGERRIRELRLTGAEAACVSRLPGARVLPLSPSGEGKGWFQVELKGESEQ